MIRKGRTILLCVILVQMCLEYSIVYEAVRHISAPVRFSIFGFYYSHTFAVLLIIVLIITLFLNFILFVYGMKGHKQIKKNFVIVMFGFHCIIVIPFFISGIYLYVLANHQDALVIDSEQSKEFFDVLNTTILIKTHIKEKVLTIQNHFCCCGYFNSSDWQNAAGRQNGASLSVVHENDTLTCPIPAESQCREKFYEGCVTKIPRIGCTFILVSSLIGLFCGFVALITSPCVYGSFEYDRRLARAKYIRQWRFQLDRELEEQRNFENDNMQPAVRRETQETLELLTSTTQQSLDDSKLDGKLMDDIKLSHKDATHGQNLLYVSQSRDASNSETDAHRRDHKGRASSSQSLITNQSLEQHHGESKHSQDE